MGSKVVVAIGDKVFSDANTAYRYLNTIGPVNAKIRLVSVPIDTPTMDDAALQAEIDAIFAECDAILNS